MKKRTNETNRPVVLLAFLMLFLLTDSSYAADLIVVNKLPAEGEARGSLAFVDLESGAIEESVPVGEEPHEVAVSDDGQLALVTNPGSVVKPGNTLSLLDVSTHDVIQRVNLGALWKPHGVVYKHGLFFFTAEGARVLAAYDPERNDIVWINGSGQEQTHMLLFSDQGKQLLATSRISNTISLFELVKPGKLLEPDAWELITLPLQGSPEALASSLDGKDIWVGLRDSGEIAIVDLKRKKIREIFKTDAESIFRLHFSLDGLYVAATDPRKGKLYLIDPVTHLTIQDFDVGEGASDILFHPDGQHLVVSVTHGDEVVLIDLHKMAIEKRIEGFQEPDGLAWIGLREPTGTNTIE